MTKRKTIGREGFVIEIVSVMSVTKKPYFSAMKTILPINIKCTILESMDY